MKLVIVGRTATGKTELASRLRALGLSVMTTTTTRPPRFKTFYAQTSSGNIVKAVPNGNGDFTFPEAAPDETCTMRPDLTVYEDGGHYFISADEAAAIPDAEKMLYTTDTGYEYFVTRDELERADVCVLDPNGLENLSKLIPETSLHLVHAVSVDDAAMLKLAISRADDPVAEQAILAARQTKEDPVFKAFEDKIKALDVDPDARVQDVEPLYPNCVAIHPFKNDYTDETIQKTATYLLGYHNMFRNLKTIVGHAIDLGIVVSSTPGCIDTMYQTQDGTPGDGASEPKTYVKMVPIELYVDLLLGNPDLMYTLIRCWLSHEQDLGQPVSLARADLEDVDPDGDEQLSLFDEVKPADGPDAKADVTPTPKATSTATAPKVPTVQA